MVRYDKCTDQLTYNNTIICGSSIQQGDSIRDLAYIYRSNSTASSILVCGRVSDETMTIVIILASYVECRL